MLKIVRLFAPSLAGKGLGDVVEKLVKPGAIVAQRARFIDCLDKNKELKPESGCAERRRRWNRVKI